MKNPKLFVVSAPSGGGKTTIVKAILEHHPEFEFSVSATTRPKRANEEHGKDYFFLRKEEFERLIQKGALVEHEQIYGNYYGTLKSEVDRALTNGRCMVFDVDVKGGLSIKRLYGPESALIFIEPPSIAVLEQRLRDRKTEDERAFQKRMARVATELEIGKQFDYRVVNDELPRAIGEVEEIILKQLTQSP
ncbi:MAG TPA: guanylate kinase [Bacteroidota bacterium]|nr:guanylate kinase [Bacteroidota bacterium]